MSKETSSEQTLLILQRTPSTKIQSGSRKSGSRMVMAGGQMLVITLLLLAGLIASVRPGASLAYADGLTMTVSGQDLLVGIAALGIVFLLLLAPTVLLIQYLRGRRQSMLGRSIYRGAVGLQIALVMLSAIVPTLTPSLVTSLAQQTPVIGDNLAAASGALLGKNPVASAAVPAAPVIVSSTISQISDDAEEFGPGLDPSYVLGQVYLISTDLEMVDDLEPLPSGNQKVGMRFNSIAVPPAPPSTTPTSFSERWRPISLTPIQELPPSRSGGRQRTTRPPLPVRPSTSRPVSPRLHRWPGHRSPPGMRVRITIRPTSRPSRRSWSTAPAGRVVTAWSSS